MFTFKMTLLIFTLVFSTCYATDKNFDEENNERPMNQNTLDENEIVPKWPKLHKISKQVRPYTDGEAENDHDYENTELSPENQLAVVDNSSVSQNKRTCPSCLYISNVWKNISARKRTEIVAYGCCPCILIRDLPDVLAFFVWLIFYVCALPGKSIICEQDPTARDVTGGIAIFFGLLRVFKFCKKQYKLRPTKVKGPPIIDRFHL
jgi:hypothetical protein